MLHGFGNLKLFNQYFNCFFQKVVSRKLMPNRRNTCPKAPQAFFAHKPKIFEENPGHFLESLTLPKTHTEQTHRTKNSTLWLT